MLAIHAFKNVVKVSVLLIYNVHEYSVYINNLLSHCDNTF